MFKGEFKVGCKYKVISKAYSERICEKVTSVDSMVYYQYQDSTLLLWDTMRDELCGKLVTCTEITVTGRLVSEGGWIIDRWMLLNKVYK